MIHKLEKTEKILSIPKILKGCARQMNVKAVKALALFLAIALLLPLFPRTASADGGSVATPQIAVGTCYNDNQASASSCVAVLKSNGTVWMWGASGDTLPYMVPGPDGTGVLSGVVSLKGNGDGFLALKGDGTVWGWGYNGNGALGNGNKLNQPYPAQVKDLNDPTDCLTGITAISCGGYDLYPYALALKVDGTVWSWGKNSSGQLGIGSSAGDTYTTAQQVHGTNDVGYLTDITAISAGLTFSMALRSDNTVWTWGKYTGDGTYLTKYTPVQVVGDGSDGFLHDVTNIAAGNAHALALKSDGTLWSWGRNWSGEVGNNTTVPVLTPVQVLGVNASGFLTGVTDIYSTYYSNMVVAGGKLYAWGINSFGIIGDGTTTNQSTPVQVLGVDGSGTFGEPVDLMMTPNGVFALMPDGSVVYWGEFGSFGMVNGNPLTLSSLYPTSFDYYATALTSDTVLSERNIDGSTVSVELMNHTWSGTPTAADFTVTTPTGVSISTVTKTGPDSCRLTLSHTGGNISTGSLTITIAASALTKGEVATVALPITLYNEAAALTSAPSPLNEDTLDGAVLTISLTGCLFKSNSLAKTTFTLNNAPAGVSIASVSSVSDTQYHLTLAYDGTDFSGDIAAFSVTVAQSALTNGDSVTSGSLTITGTAAPMTISPDMPLTESNLSGRLLNVVLGTGTFADDTLNKANFTLENAPDGVSVGNVLYISPTRCVVSLSYDGSYFAANYTRFHLVLAGTELTGGSMLYGQNLPITAISTGTGKYTLTPVTGTAYTITTNGSGSTIASMTVTAAGFKYFTVNVLPLENHSGMERVVFVQTRGGVQLVVNATAADFDRTDTAKAGFNVQAGDIIKAYIVDNTTGDEDANPTLLQ
ncbi:MAG: RCC1 domain-containing protein [Desulfitobacteriaceae bacterium]